MAAAKKKASDASYPVGYGKPPKAHQFKPGQSGNPRGRPKAKQSLSRLHHEPHRDIILQEAYRLITVRDGDKEVQMPVFQAVFRSIGLSAAKGNSRAQRMFADYLRTAEGETRARHDAVLEAAVEYKAYWEQELHRRKELGIRGREPILHPDQVNIDWITGDLAVTGPLTQEEKATWDELRQIKDKLPAALAQTKTLLAENPDDPALLEDLRYEQNLYEQLLKLIADR